MDKNDDPKYEMRFPIYACTQCGAEHPIPMAADMCDHKNPKPENVLPHPSGKGPREMARAHSPPDVLTKFWWFVTLDDGVLSSIERLLVSADRTDYNLVHGIPTRNPVSFAEARREMATSVPDLDVKFSEFPKHNIPHVEVISTRSEDRLMWMALEGASLLDAAIRASGLMAQKKTGK